MTAAQQEPAMIKSQPGEDPDSSANAIRESRDSVLDPFAKVHERYHECASAVTDTYRAQVQTVYRDYINAVKAAQTVREPELRREALQVATDKYVQACRMALDVGDSGSEGCYRDYLRDLQEAWSKADIQNTTTGAVAAIAQAMLQVAWKASGNCVY